LFFAVFSHSQRNINAANIADCDGGINIDRPGDYTLEFTGNNGEQKELGAFPSLDKIDEVNTLWSSFSAPFDGFFTLNAFTEGSALDMLIFKSESQDFCSGILSGRTEIERIVRSDKPDTIGLSKPPSDKSLYGIDLTKGEEIYIMFNITENARKKLSLYVEYEPKNNSEAAKDLIQLLDNRTDVTAPKLDIKIRDKSTGLPVKGQLIIKESKSKNAMYMGSDFLFTIDRRTNLLMNVDAPGYFFQDYEESFEGKQDYEIIVWLEPAIPGLKIEIPGIQFNMGSSDFSSGTEPRIRRLKDFMSLNSEVRIEIQGHVHAVGENSFSGKRLSLARAKKVMQYLEESGIDKNRMEAVGFGNEFMVYPEPKFTWQEQANRRVEIKVIE
jgi:outer membrane protein OmpA-like peptidoglycan-associated protein